MGTATLVKCGDCGPDSDIVEVSTSEARREVPSDEPTGALMCRSCCRFLGWVA
jgi:hypothetical protein